MNPSLWIPFFLVASAPKDRRSRLAEAMIPAMAPLPAPQMAAVAAISADAQVRREDRRVAAAQTELATKTTQLTAATTKLTEMTTAASLATQALASKAQPGSLTAEEYNKLSAALEPVLSELQLSDALKTALDNLKAAKVKG